ncbi:MAG: pantoate--beta-alanine ligase [Nitrospirota bacterium]
MKTITSILSLQKILSSYRGKKRIGLVPTMGAFHDGHLALMRTAKKECDIVIVSLFVNPLQFGPSEDLKRYPRDLARDSKMAESVGVDFLFAPMASAIVPPDLDTTISVSQVTKRWEGAARPAHFAGVATIVAKLFQIIKPDAAYFGQKDYQQTVVIRKMAKDLHFDLMLRIRPTVREDLYSGACGLAKSSRNQFLSLSEKASATVLYRALCHAKKRVDKGEQDCTLLQKEVAAIISLEPDVRPDYIAFCHPETLEPVLKILEKTVLLLAVWIGKVRLIDNIILANAPRHASL